MEKNVTFISTRKNRKNKYYISALITTFVFIALIGLELFRNGSYFDEILGVASFVFVLVFNKRISRQDVITLLLLGIVILVGVISNIVSGLVTSVTSIGIDIVVETKLIMGFIAMKYLTNEKEKLAIINALVPFSKLFVLSSFACAIISQFVNTGMTLNKRYGIKTFRFVFDFTHQYTAVYIIIIGIIVCNTIMSDRKRNIYRVMALIALLFSTKSPAIMFTSIYIGLYFYFQKNKNLKLWVYVVGFLIIIWLGQYQINEYLATDTAPRRVFFEYSFKTANHYFPLGSGFSTFGSGEAQHNYSPLYYTYGFNHMFGMSPKDPAFLCDTFWPMAIGQFGWIGSIIYMVVYVRIFKTIDRTDYDYDRRAFLYGAYFQYIIHSIGSAILSSSAGMIGFIALALFCTQTPNENKNKSRLKIHF